MSIKITYFVHSTTTDNEKKICTGWNQGELSEKGLNQAKDLSSLIDKKAFDIVFCSDLKRAVQSAELYFDNSCEIISDNRLREANYGTLNGAYESCFNEDHKVYINSSFPSGESYMAIEKRLREFLCFLVKNYDGKHIAIVSHRAPQLALEIILKNKSWEQAIDEDWRKKKAWQPGWEYVV